MKEAMKLAINALNTVKHKIDLYQVNVCDDVDEAIKALEEALAKQEQECKVCNGMGFQDGIGDKCFGCNGHGMVGNILDSDICPFCKGLCIDQQPKQEQGEPVACLVGTKGSAFDTPETKRAYTYAEQPNNVVAYKLGKSCTAAAGKLGGDSIDAGLSLLKELQAEGFGVFDLGAEYTTPQQRTWVGLTDEEMNQWIEEEHDVLRWAEAKLKEKNDKK